MYQHAQKLLEASYDSLHYFVVWLGNGHRTANILQLWGFPPETDTDDQWYRIRANILESVFCRVFGKHHGQLLAANDDAPTLGGISLNIVSPLIQGGKTLEMPTLAAAEAMNRSPDPQIRWWSPFRWAHKTQKHRLDTKRQIFRMDFEATLEEAVADQRLFQAVSASLKAPTRAAEPPSQETSLQPRRFTGNLSTKLGWILDHAFVNPAAKTISNSI